MKKFLKILFYVIVIYINFYISYNVYLLLKILDLHFIIFLSLFFLMSFWLVKGLMKPKKLPFLQITQNRIIMVLIYLSFIWVLFMMVIFIETSYYKRDAVKYLKTNISYLKNFTHSAHPFTGDSYSIKTLENFQEEDQLKDNLERENLPAETVTNSE